MGDKRSYFDMQPKEVYALFLSALAGLEDDASIEGYSKDGQENLRAALQAFELEYRQRHSKE